MPKGVIFTESIKTLHNLWHKRRDKMKDKHLILDLDHSLYDYEKPHRIALSNVQDFFSNSFRIPLVEVKQGFKQARLKTHLELLGRAASHNRLLYFQKMLEGFGLQSTLHALDLYNHYWDTFLENIHLDMGVEEFLTERRSKGVKTCLLTDLTAHIQFRKIQKLDLSHYLDFVVTSEEVGVEKPHPYMFTKALQKLECTAGEAIMIGDSWEKDIVGAQAMGIRSIWINRKNEVKDLPDSVQEVAHFNEIIL